MSWILDLTMMCLGAALVAVLLVCSCAAAPVDPNWGLAVGIPAGVAILVVGLRVWMRNGRNRHGGSYVDRQEHRDDIQGLHRRITDESVPKGECARTVALLSNQIDTVRASVDATNVRIDGVNTRLDQILKLMEG